VAERSWKPTVREFVLCFLYFAWRLWKSVVMLPVPGKTISGRVDSAYNDDGVLEASIAVDRNSIGQYGG
jgi:hypothetical protein